MEHVDTAVQYIVSVLFNGVWEAPLFALAAWLVLRVRPCLNATTRHSLFAAALFASVILPIVTAATVTTQSVSGLALSSIDTKLVPSTAPYPPLITGSSVSTRTRNAVRSTPVALPIPSFYHANVSLPRMVVFAVVAFWLAGAAIGLVRLLVGLLHLERLKSDALPLAVEYRAQLPRWSAAMRGARSVRLCRSSDTAIPVAVGLGDAMILVPEHFLQQFEPHEIDAIVLHELAHLRRGDDWLNALERVATALLFYNPGILWLVGQLNLEREVACDDWVLQSSEALPYATCLSKVVETTSWPYHAMTTPGAFVTRRGMSIRIERLLAKQRDVGVHTAIGPAGATVAILAVFGIAVISASPSIAYSAAREPALIAPSPSAEITRKVETSTPAPPLPKAAAAQGEASQHPRSHPPPPVTPALPTVAVSTKGAVRTKSFASVADPHLISIATDAAGTEQIVAAANAPGYIDELASAGYDNLSIDELIQMRAVGVTAAFIRGLQREGMSHPPIADLVKFRALGVDGAFVRSIRRHFGASTSVDDIVSMKAVGVSIESVDQLATTGLPNLTVGQARILRALDVTPAYIRDLSRAGYANLSFEQIQQLKALGIDSAYIALAARHGFHHPSIEELVKLKAVGVL